MHRKQVLAMGGVSLLTIMTAVLVGYLIARVIGGIGRPPQALLDTPPASAGAAAEQAERPATITATPEREQAVLAASGADGDPVASASTSLDVTDEAPPATVTVSTSVPPPTLTPRPSASAAPPTLTPRPSASAAPPTLTPRPSASAAPPTTQPTQIARSSPVPAETIFISDTFSAATSGWPIQEAEGWSASYVDGRYQLTLHGAPRIGISYPLTTQDYRLSADVAVESGGAGFVFLFGPDNAFYWFGISTDGAYILQKLQGNKATSVVDWTASDVLPKVPGQSVRLRLERRGTLVQFYANDRPLAEFTVPPGAWNNRYGFLIMSRTQQARASFDNLLGERLSD